MRDSAAGRKQGDTRRLSLPAQEARARTVSQKSGGATYTGRGRVDS